MQIVLTLFTVFSVNLPEGRAQKEGNVDIRGLQLDVQYGELWTSVSSSVPAWLRSVEA